MDSIEEFPEKHSQRQSTEIEKYLYLTRLTEFRVLRAESEKIDTYVNLRGRGG